MGAIQALAPSFGAVAPYNGSSGSISGDWVAPPPRNIHKLSDRHRFFHSSQIPQYFSASKVHNRTVPLCFSDWLALTSDRLALSSGLGGTVARSDHNRIDLTRLSALTAI